METPPPVNVNALSALLSKSKSVMQKVETTNPITLSETTQKLTALEEMNEPSRPATPLMPTAPAGYTREQVMNSKFPPAIKEAMLKSIPKQSESLEDKSDLDDIKMIPNKRAPIMKQPIKEGVKQNSDLITISLSQLDEMINEKLMKILAESYTKTITEAAIKKTITTLLNEGKINVKKK